MKVVVGLGNPGSKYSGTRHNIGFELVDYLSRAPGAGAFRSKFESRIADLGESGGQLLLVKPETFMNLSGRAVRQIVDFYKVALTDLLIVCDDIALPLGKIRLKSKGSHGGQNGLRNIEAQLGTNEYHRLRLGVGGPGERDAADYVLSRFGSGERSAVENTITEAALTVMVWATDGVETAMNRFNGESLPPKKPRDAAKGDIKSDKAIQSKNDKAGRGDRSQATGTE